MLSTFQSSGSVALVVSLNVYGFNVLSYIFCSENCHMSLLLHLCSQFFDNWSLKYCSAVIGVCLMCLVFLAKICPVVAMHILYDLPL